MLSGLNQIEDISRFHGDHMRSPDAEDQSLAKFETGEGDLFSICTTAQNQEMRVTLLNAIVDIY